MRLRLIRLIKQCCCCSTVRGKKVDKLMPLIMTFTSQTITPLLDKIDIVHYTERARVLKIAEEYATRLLAPFHPDPEAVARKLVNAYPAHDFVIGREELDELLGRGSASEGVLDSLMDLEDYLTTQRGTVAIGRVVEKNERGEQGEPGSGEDAGTNGNGPERDNEHIQDEGRGRDGNVTG
jgi:hypothetical protein